MNKIVLNNVEIPIDSFSRNTSLSDGVVYSNAMVSINNDMDYSDELQDLIKAPITSLKLKVDDEIVYNLENINAQITSINENLYANGMNINLNIIFN